MIPLRKLFGLAANSKPATNVAPGLAISLAVNVELTGESGWKRLAPYGETDYWEKQPDNIWRKFTQIFSREQAVRMEGAFNVASAKPNFRGLPIYIGHPDFNPIRWPDDKRLGKINGLEAREDGLWVNVEWNDLGRKNAQEGYYIYPSPAWLYPKALAAQTGQVLPDELQSVGLTNTPNIEDVDAWTNTAPEGGPDRIDDSTLNQDEDPAMNEHKKKLLQLLGLPDTATDDEINAALTAYNEKAEKATKDADDAITKAEKEKTDAVTAANTASADAARYQEIAINSKLDAAINSGRITAAERPGFETKFAADFDATAKELSEKRPALNTQPLNLKPTGDAGDLTTAHGRQIAFNTAIDAQMLPIAQGGKGVATFDAAISAIRATPEGAALLKSMGN